MPNDELKPKLTADASRRDFLSRALTVGAGLTLGAALPDVPEAVEAQTAPACAPAGQTLVPIQELGKTGAGPVQAVIKILNENKTYWAKSSSGGAPVCQSGQMRYITGSKPGGPQLWPKTQGTPQPGPTLRARVGDTVQVTLLNQVDVNAFGSSLDAGERGEGCDVATSAGPTGATNTYPGNPPFDTMPDCFHGSSTANLHYHGTHVSPNVLEDNVFVQLRPSPRVNGKPVVDEAYLKANGFDRIFNDCMSGHSPTKWSDLPSAWSKKQERLLKEYDDTAVWKGKRGATPDSDRLWTKDQEAIAAGQWPQFYVGAYPSCFKIPAWNGRPESMGQSPGTHWYHAHKHGSTALNLSNGMAGAFIIEGEYDDKLKPYFDKEVVLVLQQFAAQINLLRAPGTTASDIVCVNGQMAPVVEMAPGEVQMWRIVNACHQAAVPINGPGGGIKWVQTAQDGVQLHPDNYALGVSIAQGTGQWTNATLTTPMTAAPWFGNLAPGNRVDMLVQAPNTPGATVPITFGGGTLLMTVKVGSTAVPSPKTFPPPQSGFPTMPGFLNDLNPADVVVSRALHFKTDPGPGRGSNGAGAPPKQVINGKKFEDHLFDQTMQLGAVEEWTLFNDGGPAHPFHIHINPFQVIEIKTSATAQPIQLPKPWIWWDDIAIPPGGYIKFLSHFVDFTGAYVLHCHILGHEDRGMMEMVRVIDPHTTISHH
jgi:FtsP/CotA-like multicopper oxidase with cupredoxin domain